jgi:hypothetical protein
MLEMIFQYHPWCPLTSKPNLQNAPDSQGGVDANQASRLLFRKPALSMAIAKKTAPQHPAREPDPNPRLVASAFSFKTPALAFFLCYQAGVSQHPPHTNARNRLLHFAWVDSLCPLAKRTDWKLMGD